VGRQAAQAEVGRRLVRAAERDGSILCVIGPPGSGRTAILEDAVGEAQCCGFEVVRADPGDLIALDSPTPRLVIIDDADAPDDPAVAWLRELENRLVGRTALALVALGNSIGMRSELQLAPLTRAEIGEMFPVLGPDAQKALHLASGGLPGPVTSLASVLAVSGPGADPVVTLALAATSSTSFLAVDPTLIRLLETAAARHCGHGDRARLLARLARELLADSTAAGRRRALLDEALSAARSSADPRVVAEVLDARIYALWDPHAAPDRLSAAAEIVLLAREAGDTELERDGLFWRFVALMELSRVEEAEAALAAFAAESRTAGDVSGQAMTTAREAMLAVLRGRFQEAERLIVVLGGLAHHARRSDTADIMGSLLGALGHARRDSTQIPPAIRALTEAARLRPGHFFEATLARVFLEDEQPDAARAEMERVLPQVLAGSGPRWLGAASDLAVVCARTGDVRRATDLYSALLPYAGRMVVWGAANTVLGPVDHYLGLLAQATGDLSAAAAHLQSAVGLQERIGALPGLAESLTVLADVLHHRRAPGDETAANAHRHQAQTIVELLGIYSGPADALCAGGWSLSRDGTDWLLEAGSERARLRDSKGLQHLRALLAAPGQDISALDLLAGGAGLIASTSSPVLDSRALQEFRRRIKALEAQLDAADGTGDTAASQRATAERNALLAEVRRSTGLGRRQRAISAESERARVNATRTLRAAIVQISAAAPLAGAHLDASIRTGYACRYEAGPRGPARWSV